MFRLIGDRLYVTSPGLGHDVAPVHHGIPDAQNTTRGLMKQATSRLIS